jgi:hypothetical protein
MRKVVQLDILLAIILIFFSVALFYFVIPSQINEPSYINSKYLSPAFIPRLFSICLGCVALLLLAQSVAQLKDKQQKKAQFEQKTDLVSKTRKKQYLAFFLWGSCCLFVYSVELLGILIPSILFLGALLSYFGEKRWILNLSIMILIPTFLYLFFHVIVNVQFPEGILLT